MTSFVTSCDLAVQATNSHDVRGVFALGPRAAGKRPLMPHSALSQADERTWRERIAGVLPCPSIYASCSGEKTMTEAPAGGADGRAYARRGTRTKRGTANDLIASGAPLGAPHVE